MGIFDENSHIFYFIWRVMTQPYMVETFKSMEKMRRHLNNAMEKTKLPKLDKQNGN